LPSRTPSSLARALRTKDSFLRSPLRGSLRSDPWPEFTILILGSLKREGVHQGCASLAFANPFCSGSDTRRVLRPRLAYDPYFMQLREKEFSKASPSRTPSALGLTLDESFGLASLTTLILGSLKREGVHQGCASLAFANPFCSGSDTRRVLRPRLAYDPYFMQLVHKILGPFGSCVFGGWFVNSDQPSAGLSYDPW